MADNSNKGGEEEVWESANCSAGEYTPHSSRRIHYYCYLPKREENEEEEAEEEIIDTATATTTRTTKESSSSSLQLHHIDIESVDTTNMSLLDVCNYTTMEKDSDIDGSGHCVWLGALFFLYSISTIIMIMNSSSSSDDNNNVGEDEDEGSSSSSTNDSSSSSSHYYFNNSDGGRRIAEMGCGTGAAGIGLIKILLFSHFLEQQQQQQQGGGLGGGGGGRREQKTVVVKSLPLSMTFLDNDPEALELCRKNCQRNGIDESFYDIQQQKPWADLSSSSSLSSSSGPLLPQQQQQQQQQQLGEEEEEFSFDTIIATDVLYDLKIIRPFLQTASRFLLQHKNKGNDNEHDHPQQSNNSNSSNNTQNNNNNNNNNNKKYLILSHVPRWFLPRSNNNNREEEEYNASSVLEKHIVQEASQFGFQLIRTIRPKQVMGDLLLYNNNEISTTTTTTTSTREILDGLQDMEEANAVLWVFVLP